MYKEKKIACVIPARLQSKRLPEKVLKNLSGKPILQWIFEAASQCDIFDRIIFAVDDQKVLDLVTSFGGRAIMTSLKHTNGTSRIIEVMETADITADIWVNWQGDEPFIQKPIILDLLEGIDKPGDVWTLKRKIHEPQLIEDTSVVKVVCNYRQEAMYFSRYPIPFDIKNPHSPRYKHIGIYAFSKEALRKISTLKETEYEKQESLEQLK